MDWIKRNFLVSIVWLGVAVCTDQGFGEEDSPRSPTAAMRLDQSIDRLLANNPDIRLAEIKVQEAEAILVRTRMEVSQRFLEIRATYEHNHFKAESLAKERRLLLEKRKEGSLPAGDSQIEEIEQMLFEACRKRDEAQSQISFLTGQPAGPNVTRVYPLGPDKSVDVVHLLSSANPETYRAAKIELFAPNNSMVVTASTMTHESLAQTLTMLRRVNLLKNAESSEYHKRFDVQARFEADKRMDAKLTVAFHEATPIEVAAKLSEQSPRHFLVDPKLPSEKSITLHLADTSLLRILQAIEDLTEYHFVELQHGILLTTGAVPAELFDKPPTKEKPDAHDFEQSPSK